VQYYSFADTTLKLISV